MIYALVIYNFQKIHKRQRANPISVSKQCSCLDWVSARELNSDALANEDAPEKEHSVGFLLS